VALLALLLAICAVPSAIFAAGIQECFDCHDDKVKADAYGKSAHGELVCVSCHVDVNTLGDNHQEKGKVGKVSCARCHKAIAAEAKASVHGANDVSCDACHGSIHNVVKGRGKLAVTASCSECHADEYLASAHGQALAKGNTDSPSCVDCHEGPHSLAPLSAEARRAMTTESCVACHGDPSKMSKAGIESTYVAHYEEGYHGKIYKLGYNDRVAGCSDCHTAHNVLAAADAKSSVHKANLATTCKGPETRCHPNSNDNFAQYAPHASHKDKVHYPILFWTFLAMSGLLIGTFAFFWLHTLLWWQRAFREKRENRGKPEVEHHDPALALDGAVYRRFGFFEIFMHLTVIVSFLGLTLSGLPLKFPDAFWAEALMKFMGGAKAAGVIHRWMAILTFFYFIAVNIKVWHYLLIKKTGQGFFGKLFGPDSLFPNLDDLAQMIGMFKWFFNKGPRPQFGKWTYWEKFDFLAVFWGMFAIGGSGLMLWKPEWFAQYVPGWFFNVAAIIHADEALLATGFIYTVHFFNTHLRPEKFPMDPVIFTGKVTRHEMIEERALQIPVERKRGTLDGMKTGYASAGVEFISQVFGYAALFVGLLCLGMIVTGFFG
jgi:cytochrome b subunit of formate dehydrogenase